MSIPRVLFSLTIVLPLVPGLVFSGCTRENAHQPAGETPPADVVLDLEIRRRVPSSTEGMEDSVVTQSVQWNTDETAIIVTDMWDRHWCDGATRRVGEMAPRMNEMLEVARDHGILVVHAASDVIDFYKDHPARSNVIETRVAPPPTPIRSWYDPDPEIEPPLPIDDSDGGCDYCEGECVEKRAWNRQIEAIAIHESDGISADGEEIFSFFQAHGIKNVMLMGVHTNMCVLGRPFGIRAQLAMGKNVVLVRDLTDAMYNPEMSPYVSHDEGTALVIQHIERHLAPTVLSADVVATGKR